MFKVNSFVVAVLLLVVSSTTLYAKPAPPEALNKILGELSEVEERFEDENWTGAREALGEIVELFVNVNSAHAEVIPANLSSGFLATAKKLDQLLEAKDEEAVEDSYIQLQVTLFDIMSYFEYRVHPVIGVMKKYIGDEAKEALKESNLEEVYSELKEVVTVVTKNASLLQRNGIKHEKIQEFMKALGEAMKQAKANETAALKASLASLESQVDDFQKSFN